MKQGGTVQRAWDWLQIEFRNFIRSSIARLELEQNTREVMMMMMSKVAGFFCKEWKNANKATATKTTLIDSCQLLTFCSYISRLSDTKVPFTQSFTELQRTHITSRINHSYFVTVILGVQTENGERWTSRRRRRRSGTCSCWFYWWWLKTGINSLSIFWCFEEQINK